jgi:FtsP/CotA-like multicopper oxidase with cupredoxin domain
MRSAARSFSRTLGALAWGRGRFVAALGRWAAALVSVLVLACNPIDRAPTARDKQSTSTFTKPAVEVVDTNPEPNVFEAELTVAEQDVTIDGTVVHATIYKDVNNPSAYTGTPDGIPVPQFTVNVGDEVIVTLTNDLDASCTDMVCNTSIHWHGVEVDGDSDGTGVTQNRVEPGDSYTYRFFAPRPGIFWFHSHIIPGPQTFAGVYGSFIVKDPNEPALQSSGAIPSEADTHTIVLSDIEYDSDGDVGYVDTGGDAVPWHMLMEDCAAGTGSACQRVKDAATVLVNGVHPTASTPVITAKSGSGIRLRLLNVSTFRYFRLRVNGNGSDDNLYRIGGEGGFLDTVRLEGGMLGSYDTKYLSGEILLSSSARADVVVVPTGSDGDVITITGEAVDRGGGPSNNDAAGDLLHIRIDNGLDDTPFSIAAGNDVLGPGGVEDVKGLAATTYTDPVPMVPGPGSGSGLTDPNILLGPIMTGQLAVNGIMSDLEDSGPDFTQVPLQGATRYAETGDLLEFSISNTTNQHHPFHHHGFSFQPVRIVRDSDSATLYTFDYSEFEDVIDVPKGITMVVRMRLEDRPRITDTRQEASAPAPDQFFASGGAAGRWVFHCHLFIHAAMGMMSELVVLNADHDGDGSDTSVDCDDSNPAVPADEEVCDDGIDNDCNGLVDDDCNHPPVADAGEDQDVECSQAGGSLVTLDGTGSSDPDMDTLSYSWSAAGIVFDDPTSPTPSAVFPLGSTTVTLTVSDGELEDSDDVVITIADNTPPTITVSASPATLWPPNHKLVTVTATVNVTDVCDPHPTFVLTAITSNEPDNANGDGNTTNDIQGANIGTPDVSFQLRSEREGPGSGRIYTIEYSASDASGNDASATTQVRVPHNQ